MEIPKYKKESQDSSLEARFAEADEAARARLIEDAIIAVQKAAKKHERPLPYFKLHLPVVELIATSSPEERQETYDINTRIYDMVVTDLNTSRQRDLFYYPGSSVSRKMTKTIDRDGAFHRLEYNRVDRLGYLMRDTVIGNDGVPEGFSADFRGPSEAVEHDLMELRLAKE